MSKSCTRIWDNKWECVYVCKEIMCWYGFLKCYAKIYGFSLLDAWSCFRLYFHVVFDHKHLKLEPLIFESKKDDVFMSCDMKITNRGVFWAISRTREPCFAHAKLAEAHLLSVVLFAHAIRSSRTLGKFRARESWFLLRESQRFLHV